MLYVHIPQSGQDLEESEEGIDSTEAFLNKYSQVAGEREVSHIQIGLEKMS